MHQTGVPDYYALLGLDPKARSDEVQKAFHRLAQKTHPDTLPMGLGAETRRALEEDFKRINEAYSVLKDPQKRQIYDATLSPEGSPKVDHCKQETLEEIAALREQGDIEGAARAAAELHRLFPQAPDCALIYSQILQSLALTLADAGALDEAIAYLKLAQKISPDPVLQRQQQRDLDRLNLKTTVTSVSPPPRPSKPVQPQSWQWIALGVVLVVGSGIFWSQRSLPLGKKSEDPRASVIPVPPVTVPSAPSIPLKSRFSPESQLKTPTKQPRKQGTIVVRAYLTAEGAMVRTKILRSSGLIKIDRAATSTVLNMLSTSPKKGKVTKHIDIPLRYQTLANGYMLY